VKGIQDHGSLVIHASGLKRETRCLMRSPESARAFCSREEGGKRSETDGFAGWPRKGPTKSSLGEMTRALSLKKRRKKKKKGSPCNDWPRKCVRSDAGPNAPGGKGGKEGRVVSKLQRRH